MTGGADHRRLDALAGADQADRFLREVAAALGWNQDQRAAAIGHEAALPQPERVGDHPRHYGCGRRQSDRSRRS
jgi:hypothetical protein